MDSDLAWVNGKSGRQSWCCWRFPALCNIGSHLPFYKLLTINQWKKLFVLIKSMNKKLSLRQPTVLPHSTFRSHVTSSVTWPFDTPRGHFLLMVRSNGVSISSRFRDIALYKSIGVTHEFDLLGSRNNLIAHMPFPIGGPLEPSLYLSVSEILNVECKEMVDMTLIRPLNKGQLRSYIFIPVDFSYDFL